MYCTYLTVYSGNKLPPFYIGHSSISKVESGYHGTVLSKKYKSIYDAELLEHPELFKTIQLTKHKTKKEAHTKEKQFLKHFNAKHNPMFFNMNNADGAPSFKGFKHSAKTKARMRNKHKGKKFSTESRQKMSLSRTGELNHFYGKNHSEETKLKMRKSHVGKQFSNEHKEKIRNFHKGKQWNAQKWVVTFPEGNKEIITNKRQFCKNYKLNEGTLRMGGCSRGFQMVKFLAQ
jgi:hypothetical protein